MIRYRNIAYYNRESVKQVAARLIGTSEVAKILGVTQLTVQAWVRQERLWPLNLGADNPRRYIFDRELVICWRKGRLTVQEVTDLLNVSRATVHRWVEEGRLKPLEDMGGKQRWFSRDQVAALKREIRT